jgi:hypothetical protein
MLARTWWRPFCNSTLNFVIVLPDYGEHRPRDLHNRLQI